MDTVDNRDRLFELEEIYKYKDLIEATDKLVIKEVICSLKPEAKELHQNFLNLVADEVDHQLNKDAFKAKKDALISDMQTFLKG